jgi:hypothetical protein
VGFHVDAAITVRSGEHVEGELERARAAIEGTGALQIGHSRIEDAAVRAGLDCQGQEGVVKEPPVTGVDVGGVKCQMCSYGAGDD